MLFVKTFNELENNELYQILRLRAEIFVVEQNCIYQDMDNKDQKAVHIYYKEKNKIFTYPQIVNT